MSEFRVHFLDTVTQLCTNRLTDRKLNELEHLMRSESIANCFRFASDLFCDEIDRIFTENIRTTKCSKDVANAERAKIEGNEFFRTNQFEQALSCYNRGLLFAPVASDLKMILLSNRSQIHLQMKEYRKCLADIESIEECFAKIANNLRLKILWRKSMCLKNMHEYDRARDELAKLHELCPEQLTFRSKIAREIETIPSCGSFVDRTGDSRNDLKVEQRFAIETNPIYESLHKSIRIDTNTKFGRHAIASESIACGQIIAIENTYASIVDEHFWLSNCNYCAKNLDCKRKAMQSFHQYECGLLKALAEFGVSPVAFLALRLITRNHFDYILRIHKNLDQGLELSGGKTYENYGYERIYNLITHPDRDNRLKFLQSLIITVILVEFLRRAIYFGGRESRMDDEIVAKLLMKNLQVIQFNGHEINEEIVSQTRSNLAIGTNRIGFAIYPSLAFFNHSCEFGIVRKYIGNKVIVYALKSFAKNEMICENYGTSFWHDDASERQRFLRDRYRFECECRPCRNRWPSLAELKSHAKSRYRCTATCTNSGTLHDWYYSKRSQCSKCHQPFSFATLRENLAKFSQLVDLIDRNLTQKNFEAAFESLKNLSEISRIIFAQPNEFDYSIQLGLIRCVLRYGNHSIDEFATTQS